MDSQLGPYRVHFPVTLYFGRESYGSNQYTFLSLVGICAQIAGTYICLGRYLIGRYLEQSMWSLQTVFLGHMETFSAEFRRPSGNRLLGVSLASL